MDYKNILYEKEDNIVTITINRPEVRNCINNETNLCTHMDLELTLASLDLSAQTNPGVVIYLIESVDGGTDFDIYSDNVSADASCPTADKICTIFGLRIGTGAEARTAHWPSTRFKRAATMKSQPC